MQRPAQSGLDYSTIIHNACVGYSGFDTSRLNHWHIYDTIVALLSSYPSDLHPSKKSKDVSAPTLFTILFTILWNQHYESTLWNQHYPFSYSFSEEKEIISDMTQKISCIITQKITAKLL